MKKGGVSAKFIECVPGTEGESPQLGRQTPTQTHTHCHYYESGDPEEKRTG